MSIKNYLRLFKRFEAIDQKILTRLKTAPLNAFAKLWISQKDYSKHLKKRLKRGDVKNRADYYQKTITAYCQPRQIFYLEAKRPITLDKVFFISETWVDIFTPDGVLITSFPLKTSIDELLKNPKNRAYKAFVIPLTLHARKKDIICQKRTSHASDNSS